MPSPTAPKAEGRPSFSSFVTQDGRRVTCSADESDVPAGIQVGELVEVVYDPQTPGRVGTALAAWKPLWKRVDLIALVAVEAVLLVMAFRGGHRAGSRPRGFRLLLLRISGSAVEEASDRGAGRGHGLPSDLTKGTEVLSYSRSRPLPDVLLRRPFGPPRRRSTVLPLCGV
ncbi:DUF3592 domain-containing protein [Streptomyces sp. SM11]|uniref:DUF3592 domain-containing protein n=1 Tax=Streptomyces sp. SM11 TaxID=565557 RepID=UPI0035BBD6B3